MLDLVQILDLLSKGGVLFALVVAIVGGYRGWYVWSHTHDKALKAKDEGYARELKAKDELIADKNTAIQASDHDRDYWRNIALRVLTANEKTLTASERTLASLVDLTQQKQG